MHRWAVVLAMAMPASSVAAVAPEEGPVPAARLARHISDIPGMPIGITDVAQDAEGYFWISSVRGLSRYDGYEVLPWGSTPGRLTYVSTGPNGEVLGGDPRTGLCEVSGHELVWIAAPEGVRATGPDHAVYDRDGRLWATWGGHLVRRDGDAWEPVGGPEVVADGAFRLAPGRESGVLVGSSTGDVWVVDADGAARRIAHDLGGWIMQLHDDPLGPVATVRKGTRPGLVRVTDDGVEYLLEWAGRADGLVRRNATYWVAYTTGVWAVHDDGRREYLTTAQGFYGFGSLAVDREGGLWAATKRGLSHFPQPDTRLWTELTGLPHTYLREIHPVGDGFVVTSWRGPMLFDRDGTARDLDLPGLFTRSIGCLDPSGGLWFKAFARPESLDRLDTVPPRTTQLVEWRDGRSRVWRTDAWYSGELVCDRGPDDSFWMLVGDELVELTDSGPVTRSVMPAEARRRGTAVSLSVLDDGGGVLAVFQNDETCEAPLPGRERVLEAEVWTCEPFTAGTVPMDTIEPGPGRVWLAAAGGGVFEKTGEQWRRVPGELASLGEVISLDPSPSGGLWVIGWRDRWRVETDTVEPVVVERLGTAQGVPPWENGQGLYEEPDRTVWLPLYPGLVRVPAGVRQSVIAAPRVTITRLIADGRRVSADEPLELAHGNHSLEIGWSALSFRDPTRIRYRMRLDSDASWSELTQPFVRLAGLSSGRHRLELGASLDGRSWSRNATIVTFRVLPPIYLRPWVIALAVVVVGAVLALAYRVRVAQLLRVERLRTRIAMDLHDEMGAGLGSAGLLVGLLADGDLVDRERDRIGERAARQIRDLGESLSDIVWSLRPGAETLDALVLFLRQRAADLFPPGGGTTVTVTAPDPCPDVSLSLAMRRNLQWIAVEALHNAARHAGARRVEIELRPDGSRGWVLAVRDDGCGMDDTEDSTGLGRESMARRAQEIGAELSIRSTRGDGTTVSVRFDP